MTHDHDKAVDRDLEAFFETARGTAANPSQDLLARVLADAYAEQDAAVRPEITQTATAVPRRGFFAALLDTIGGWPAVAGLMTATAAGIWIGYNPPASFDLLSTQLLGNSDVLTMDTSLPDYDFLLADG